MNPADEFFDEETGIQYYAIDVEYGKREFPVCTGCVADDDYELCKKLPDCGKDKREDGIPVIFVEARHKIDE